MKAPTIVALAEGPARLSDTSEVHPDRPSPWASWSEALRRQPDDVKVVREVSPT
jgi:hypothetical protein